MIYLDNNGNYITGDSFINCGHDRRAELSEKYHYPDARELYDWIDEKTDETDSWDAVPWEAYDYLCDLCGVDIDKCEDTQVLMDKCLAEIEKEKKGR